MTGAGIIKFLASTGVISPVYFSICYAMVEESIKRSLRRLCFYKCLSVHRGGRAWLLPGGHAWLLQWGCVVAPGEGACVVFSMRYGQ